MYAFEHYDTVQYSTFSKIAYLKTGVTINPLLVLGYQVI